jgi:hypothetical protein
LLYVLASTGIANAQTPPDSKESIRRSTRAIVLDGKMGDPGWKSATMYADFKTRHPEAGKSPSERTEVYLTYDATSLYVAVRSFDHEPQKIRALATSRNNAWKDDWVVLCLNTYDDALIFSKPHVTYVTCYAQKVIA